MKRYGTQPPSPRVQSVTGPKFKFRIQQLNVGTDDELDGSSSNLDTDGINSMRFRSQLHIQ